MIGDLIVDAMAWLFDNADAVLAGAIVGLTIAMTAIALAVTLGWLH